MKEKYSQKVLYFMMFHFKMVDITETTHPTCDKWAYFVLELK